MRNARFLIFTLLYLVLAQFRAFGQVPPTLAWETTLGGNGYDCLRSLQQTTDGGYILGGSSTSDIGQDKSQPSYGSIYSRDYWVVKVDANGSKQWDKTFGGTNSDELFSLQQTADGGYILGGYSDSPVSPDKSQPSKGDKDYWVIKLNASGTKVWDKTIGGSGPDELRFLQQTSDGGYILGGSSKSPAGLDKSQPLVSPYHLDYWVVKLDANGNKVWDKAFGGDHYDELFDVKQTADGGYILGGWSKSEAGPDKSQTSHNVHSYWIIKLNASGVKTWDKTYGTTNNTELHSINQTTDGGYILGGSAWEGIGRDKNQPTKGGPDYWVVKVDSVGKIEWDKDYGGSGWETLNFVKQTTNGGYVLGGSSSSYPGWGSDKTEISQGFEDYWILQLDRFGNKVWDKTLGSRSNDFLNFVQQTTDGGFILGGESYSGIYGDKSQANKGISDFWVIKLNAPCSALGATLSTACTGGAIAVQVNFTGLQANATGLLPWSLNYTVDGVSKTATGNTPVFTLNPAALPGSVFTLTGLVSGTCTVALNQTFTVQPIPSVPVTTSGSTCGPGAVMLQATGAPAGGSYSWYASATAAIPLQVGGNGSFTTPLLNATTSYFVATVNSSGCEGPRAQVTAGVTLNPINPGNNEIICLDAGPVQLTGFSPAGGLWTGPGVSADGIFTPTSNLVGTQVITYSVQKDSCSFSATRKIEIPPMVDLIADTAFCEGNSVTLVSPYRPGTWRWSDGSTGISMAVTRPGKYWVSLTHKGCTTTDTVMVSLKDCPKPFLPNIITQSPDGKNDTFQPQHLAPGKWHLQIVNRWGIRIFETDNYRNNWPEHRVMAGTYFYLLHNPATGQKYKGWLEVTN